MIYTVTIDNTTEQAQSILNMLLVLAQDYDFLKVHEEDENNSINLLTENQDKELERRLEYVLKNPTVGKTWTEIEQQLLTQ